MRLSSSKAITLLQQFILRTSFPPFVWFYRLVYAAAQYVIVMVLGAQPCITAVYLIASMAGDEVVYGLSDIDFIIIIDEANNEDKVFRLCEKINRFIPFLRYKEIGIFSLPEITHRYKKRDIWYKYKIFTQCKKQGKFLHGADVLKKFDDPKDIEREESIIGHIAFIWKVFLSDFMVNYKDMSPLMSNYSCYKITADLCEVYIRARYQKDIFQRKAALEMAPKDFSDSQKQHVEQIKTVFKSRFKNEAPNLIENTYVFSVEINGKSVQDS
jgi:hypothetical protein